MLKALSAERLRRAMRDRVWVLRFDVAQWLRPVGMDGTLVTK